MLPRHGREHEGRHVRALALLGLFAALPFAAEAHDIWIEPGSSRVTAGGVIDLSLMLGNHGNRHRDFQLASKVSPGDRKLLVYGPIGTKYEMTPYLVDNDADPHEGFWTAVFRPEGPGLYMAASTFDKVMSYAPVRDIKSAKTFFEAFPARDQAPATLTGFNRPLGHALEIVPLDNPAIPYGLGTRFTVQVRYKGRPMARARVSFIPKGVKLTGDFDRRYERTTGADGKATLELEKAGPYLIATHFVDEKAKGKGYESIHYSATLCLIAPKG
ncbi:DUF4198 domain-containing protein [bacterium]|nr:MAG: DUF4198 domain-containing protein [bacterium]